MEREAGNQREFARVPVRLAARFRVVRGEEAEALEARLLDAPSVWAPPGEAELLKLAGGGGSGSEGVLARAILDVGHHVARLTHRVLVATGPTAVGEFLQLSGGGGLMATDEALAEGARLDLRLADEDPEAPPLRVLAEVVRGQRRSAGNYPLRFVAIHPTDQERLIRFVHSLQRRQLRRASRRGAP